MTVDCKVQFMAYARISKPIYGGGSGKMVDVMLVVYKFELKHTLRNHVERGRGELAGLGVDWEEVERKLRME